MFSSSIRKVLTDRCISNVCGNNNGVLTHFVSTLHFSAAAQQQQAQSNFRIPLPRQHEWNRAVAAAENLVGFPISCLMMLLKIVGKSLIDRLQVLYNPRGF